MYLCVILKQTLVTDILSVAFEMALQWISFMILFNIGSSNGLVTNRQQVITWANADQAHCQHMVSPGHIELTLIQ